jgi:hypothetical protein
MGDYIHLFADETERTQYERSAQYNEPYISATDDTFDAEYNKRQDKHYGVKYTDLENNMHDFTYVEYDAEIEYLQSTGTQWIDTGVDNTNTIVYSEGFLEHSGGIVTLASADPEGQVGINTFVQSVVTTGKWSVLYRAKQEHTSLHAGDLTVTIRYTKSS